MLRTAEYGAGTGTVAEFDPASGLGVIRGTDSADYPFHCTAIADGSRDIEAGTAVSFTIVAGHLGRLEATDVR